MTIQELVLKRLPIDSYEKNPYFVSLADGSFDRADFVETQIQFLHAVTFFSRPMAALAGKIPDVHRRLEIVRNVFEEHGEGDPKAFHHNTFMELLTRLGVTEADIDSRPLWPEVRIFNTCLAGACVLDEYLVGCAAMGAIESMFSQISTWIGRGIVARGWLKADQMVHYSLHAKLDVKHSQDFFQVIEDRLGDPAGAYLIDQGLWMGNLLFSGLYEGLYRARQRRQT